MGDSLAVLAKVIQQNVVVKLDASAVRAVGIATPVVIRFG
jgi:hypothetical protein